MFYRNATTLPVPTELAELAGVAAVAATRAVLTAAAAVAVRHLALVLAQLALAALVPGRTAALARHVRAAPAAQHRAQHCRGRLCSNLFPFYSIYMAPDSPLWGRLCLNFFLFYFAKHRTHHYPVFTDIKHGLTQQGGSRHWRGGKEF